MAMKKNVSVKIHFYQMNKISCATNGRNKKIVVMKMLILEFLLKLWNPPNMSFQKKSCSKLLRDLRVLSSEFYFRFIIGKLIKICPSR